MESKDNKLLKQKYQSDARFGQRMKQLSENFKAFEQMSLYSPTKQPNQLFIASIKKTNQKFWNPEASKTINLELVFGIRQPTGEKGFQRFLQDIAKSIPRPTQPYSILYFNTLAGMAAFRDFKNAFLNLPLEYYLNLQAIYLLDPSIWQQVSYVFKLFNSGTLSDFFEKKVISSSNDFSGLAAQLQLNFEEVVKLIPDQILEKMSQYCEEIQYFQSIYKLKKKQPECQVKPLKSTFSAKAKKYIQEYETGKSGAPQILEALFDFFSEQTYLNAEGLFRKSANIQELTQLHQELQNRNYGVVGSIKDPHLIASAIKRVLNSFAEPLIPCSGFVRLMEGSPENYKTLLAKIVSQLTIIRKNTLIMVVDFFKEKIVPRAGTNLMSQSNIFIVIGPCLMNSIHTSAMESAQKTKAITQVLFKSFTQIMDKRDELRNSPKTHFAEKKTSEVVVTQEQLQSLEEVDQFLSSFNRKR